MEEFLIGTMQPAISHTRQTPTLLRATARDATATRQTQICLRNTAKAEATDTTKAADEARRTQSSRDTFARQTRWRDPEWWRDPGSTFGLRDPEEWCWWRGTGN